MLMVILALFMLLTAPASAELLAVIDRSNPVTAGLNSDQLSLLSQVIRGEAARSLNSSGFSILSEENTVAILRDMGVELSSCEGECEVEVARQLQADWLLSMKLVRFGETWNLQLNMFRTATGTLVGSKRVSATAEQPLIEEGERATATLCLLVDPDVGTNAPREEPQAAKAAPESTGFTTDVATTIVPFSQHEGPLSGMTFITLPGGSFLMGSMPQESGRNQDESPHMVTLAPFDMMRTEVTQAHWLMLMGNSPSKIGCGDCPVDRVSWYMVQDFVARLNVQDPGKGYRLPTEAEWEYACRAGTTGMFFWGDDAGSATTYMSRNVTSPGAFRRLMNVPKVGARQPNAWGLHDMQGSVSEWCADWYGEYPIGSCVNPTGPDNGTERVLRGCGVNDVVGACRSAARNSSLPAVAEGTVGFRLCRSAQ